MAGALNKQGRLLYFYGLGRVPSMKGTWGRGPGGGEILGDSGIALASNNNNHDEYKFEVGMRILTSASLRQGAQSLTGNPAVAVPGGLFSLHAEDVYGGLHQGSRQVEARGCRFPDAGQVLASGDLSPEVGVSRKGHFDVRVLVPEGALAHQGNAVQVLSHQGEGVAGDLTGSFNFQCLKGSRVGAPTCSRLVS